MASTVEPDNPVAWQGLSRLFEKNPDIVTTDEAITVYTKLTDLIKE